MDKQQLVKLKGDKVEVKNSSEVAYASNNGIYTVIDAEPNIEANKTTLCRRSCYRRF